MTRTSGNKKAIGLEPMAYSLNKASPLLHTSRCSHLPVSFRLPVKALYEEKRQSERLADMQSANAGTASAAAVTALPPQPRVQIRAAYSSTAAMSTASASLPHSRESRQVDMPPAGLSHAHNEPSV